MLGLVGVFWDIVRLKRAPRELPASALLLAAVAALDFAAEFVAQRLSPRPNLALLRGLLDLALTIGVFSAVLLLYRRGNRLLQTLIALFGTGALLSVPGLALLAVGLSPTARAHLGPLLQLAQLGLLVWSVAVVAHIVRAALEVPLLTGVAVATSYAALAILIARQLLLPASG